MANVNIYPEHQAVLDGLITSNKVGSDLGSMTTGPFKEQRDAYVFAASIGVALGRPTALADMPKGGKKATISIRDSVLLGADGAKELSLVVVLLQELPDDDNPEMGLREQLDIVAAGDLSVRFGLLDRYAHAGFTWLANGLKDAGTIRELVMEAIDKVVGVDLRPEDLLIGEDPLASFLI